MASSPDIGLKLAQCALATIRRIMAISKNEGEDSSSVRLKLAEGALAPFEAAHRDLSGLWTTLETKAQGTTTVAGIFLAAAISILTRTPSDLSQVEKILILIIVAALAAAVILALLVLTPRQVPVNDPEIRFRKVANLLALEDDNELKSMLVDFYTAEKDEWSKTLASFRDIANLKARLLFGSHLATGVAVIAAIALIVLMLRF
jgi:hypothetical protein